MGKKETRTAIKSLAAAVLLLCAANSFGTPQVAEFLIYRGQTNSMFTLPLDSYFSSNRPVPEAWMAVRRARIAGSSCWRCYQGTWAITNGHFYLIDIRFPQGYDITKRESLSWVDRNGEYHATNKVVLAVDGKTNTYYSPLELLMPGKGVPLKADWYSGVLRLPRGKALKQVHMGFATIFERDDFIKIKEGKVVAEKTVDNHNSPLLLRSAADLQWSAIGRNRDGTDYDPFAPVQKRKEGDWYDARTVRTTNFTEIIRTGKNFTTRGIFIWQPDEIFGNDYLLYTPATPLTRSDMLPLTDIPDDHGIANGSHVEIRAKFTKAKEGAYTLNIKSIRALKPGESMHRLDYRPPKPEPRKKQHGPAKGEETEAERQ